MGTTSDSKGAFHLLIKENAFWDALFVTDTDNEPAIVVDVAAVGDGYRVLSVQPSRLVDAFVCSVKVL